jgi:hypothetical protein
MWMIGGKLVDILTREKFFVAPRDRDFAGCCMWMRLRPSFRLRTPRAALECLLPVTVQRFEETINGREYSIEVSPVGSDKWRAQIARAGGGSRAMMPFYGRTPDEAVKHLSHWLSLNHVRSTPQV